MASTINAAVGGIILSSDSSGALDIQAGGVNAIQVSAAQVVTLANALSVGSGGTGQTSYTNGQLLIGNTTGNTLTKATLTAGSNITITNGTGSITVAVTASANSASNIFLDNLFGGF